MHGELIEIEFSSTDVTTAAELSFRTAGEFTARTLAADERIILRDLVILADNPSALVTIFSDADDDNAIDSMERMVVVGEGTHTMNFPCGVSGAKGIVPHVIASGIAQVSITGTGVIVKA